MSNYASYGWDAGDCCQIGNHVCDHDCNQADFAYDRGDCCTALDKGNPKCDEECNNANAVNPYDGVNVVQQRRLEIMYVMQNAILRILGTMVGIAVMQR